MSEKGKNKFILYRKKEIQKEIEQKRQLYRGKRYLDTDNRQRTFLSSQYLSIL